MIAQGLVSLNDTRAFQPVPGLWTGKKGPLVRVKVLRSTDFCGDGRLDYTDVADVDVEGRQLAERQLTQGDIVVERSGGGPNQPVGRVAIFEPETSDNYCCGNFTTSIRVVDRQRFDPAFVAFYLHYWHMIGETQRLQNATTGIRNLDWSKYLEIEIPQPELLAQLEIVRVLDFARSAYVGEDSLCNLLRLGKASIMERLFTRGLRGEAQKESAVGLTPESWRVISLGDLGRVGNGSTPKKGYAPFWTGGQYPWLTSAKVYDREIIAADQFVTQAALDECHLPKVKPGSILIAITGQGKTLGHCAVLRIEATVNQHIAYVSIDDHEATLPSFVRGFLETQYEYLRQIASGGGSTKGALTCSFLRDLKIPMPPDTSDGRAEQSEIVEILDTLDQKIEIHKKKRLVLEALFQSLLHKLMTGEINVDDLHLSALDVGLGEPYRAHVGHPTAAV